MEKQTKLIRIHRFIAGLLLVIFLMPGLAQAASFSAGTVVALTNSRRTQEGLGALVTNDRLSSAALAKANDMFANQYFAHTSPQGKTPWDFIKSAGYNYSFAGENLAIGYSDANELMSAWMNSTTHRENILSNNFREIGIAVVEGTYEGEETIIVVQEFGTTMVAAQPENQEVASESQPAPQSTSEPSTSANQTSPNQFATAQEELILDNQKTGFSPRNIFAGEQVTIYATASGNLESLEAKIFDQSYNLLDSSNITGSANEKTYSIKQSVEKVGTSEITIIAKDKYGVVKSLNLGTLDVKTVVIAKDTNDNNSRFAGFNQRVKDHWQIYTILGLGAALAIVLYFSFRKTSLLNSLKS